MRSQITYFEIIPIVASITRELFLSVPGELKEGALALGTTRWEMVRGVVLPYARGGIAAGTLFVLPGILCIMALSYVYAALGHVGSVAALFFGLKSAVLAVVLQAVARVVRFFPADDSGMARLQTRDAGPTVDQWAALVPLRRTAPVLPYVFGDCANWWALDKFNAGVPVRVIIDPAQYTSNLWPEYWLTHAYIDKLWASGVPVLQRVPELQQVLGWALEPDGHAEAAAA